MPPPKRRTRRTDQLPPGRHGLDQEAVAASQRQRMLTAVIEVVAEGGYDDMRVTDIISSAGVSRRTFYEHFAEKEDCFLAAYDRELIGLAEATEAAFEAAGAGTWADQVRSGLRGVLRYLAAHPASARVCMVDVLGAGMAAAARRDAALRGFTYLIDAGRSQATGEVPGRTALGVIGAINELVAAEIVNGATARLQELTPDLVYVVCVPFLGPKRALAERGKAADEG